MATCKQVRVNAGKFIDKELTPGQIKTVKNHIENCENCENYLFNIEEVNRILGVLSKGGIESLPDNLRNL